MNENDKSWPTRAQQKKNMVEQQRHDLPMPYSSETLKRDSEVFRQVSLNSFQMHGVFREMSKASSYGANGYFKMPEIKQAQLS